MMYSYKIEIYDKCGNHSVNISNSVRPGNTDIIPPQANISNQILGITDSEIVFDGSKGDGVRTVHTYKKAGTIIM